MVHLAGLLRFADRSADMASGRRRHVVARLLVLIDGFHDVDRDDDCVFYR